MKPRVYIIHGWEDSPSNGWFPWLKSKLVAEGIEVHAPTMPDPDHPTIDSWVPFLQRLVGQPDAHTYFVAHSIGGQAVLRYLQAIPDDIVVGGLVLVASWVTLKPEAMEEEHAAAIARPWLDRPIHWPLIRKHVQRVTAIMSDDDQFVPDDDARIFVRELHAQLIIEHQKKHLSGFDGVTALPSVLKAVQGMMSTK
jgi:predicted alpha/beta hydrolase family esterase